MFSTFALPRVGVEIEFRPKDGEPQSFRPPIDTVLVDLMGFLPEQPIAVEKIKSRCVRQSSSCIVFVA